MLHFYPKASLSEGCYGTVTKSVNQVTESEEYHHHDTHDTPLTSHDTPLLSLMSCQYI